MSKGRPRKFDIDTSLHQAMKVFWKQGYEGTTIDDLTSVMGINRPSLYAAFGNKQKLFRSVLDLYRADPASYVNRALEKPTVREVFESLMKGAVDLLTDPANPGGCLFVHGALACSDSEADIRTELANRRNAGEADIRERLEKAAADGDADAGADPSGLAKYIMTVIWGMSVQSAGGAGRTELETIAETATRILPSKR